VTFICGVKVYGFQMSSETPRGLRTVAAVVVGLAAALFTLGTLVERSGHIDATPRPVPSPVSTSAPPTPAVTATRPQARRPSTPPTKDPGLSAPEGSAEREAAEKRARAAKAHPTSIPSTPARSAPAATPEPSPTTPPVPDLSAPEGSAEREAAEGAAGTPSERIFGINTESTALVVAADLLALVLLSAVLLVRPRRPLRLVALTIVVTSAAAVAFDVREALHQHAIGRSGLLALVVLVAVAHAAATAAGAVLFRRTRAAD
jgi:hypothetical protein